MKQGRRTWSLFSASWRKKHAHFFHRKSSSEYSVSNQNQFVHNLLPPSNMPIFLSISGLWAKFWWKAPFNRSFSTSYIVHIHFSVLEHSNGEVKQKGRQPTYGVWSTAHRFHRAGERWCFHYMLFHSFPWGFIFFAIVNVKYHYYLLTSLNLTTRWMKIKSVL